MKISILELDKNKKKQIGQYGNRKIYSYWVKYKHLYFEGSSYFVPYGDEELEYLKDFYSVETAQDEVITYKKLQNNKHFLIEYNAQDDCYKIIGQIEFISHDREIASLSIYDCRITLDFKDINMDEVEVNDWIEVTFKGLTLYDEGIY